MNLLTMQHRTTLRRLPEITRATSNGLDSSGESTTDKEIIMALESPARYRPLLMSASSSKPRRGDRVRVEIEKLVFGGDGLARLDGMAVFVPFAAAGDHAEVELTEVRRKHARGMLRSLGTTGPGRVDEEPPCRVFGQCGGCQYQHLEYETELEAKQAQVREAFQRQAKLPDATIRPIIPSPQPYGYRNRITVHVAGRAPGFHTAQGNRHVPIESCPIALPEVNAELDKLRAKLAEGWKPRGGHDHMSLRHPDIPPSAFYQANHLLLDTLRQTVSDALLGSDTAEASQFDDLIDGYAGGGFFTEVLLSATTDPTRVVAIENDERSLRDLERLMPGRASRKEIQAAPDTRQAGRLTIKRGRVEDHLTTLLQNVSDRTRAAVLVDPPRDGLSAPVLRALIEQPVQRLVYLGCNLPILARDTAALQDAYTLTLVQPIDLFPRTAQIETLAVFQRKPLGDRILEIEED